VFKLKFQFVQSTKARWKN